MRLAETYQATTDAVTRIVARALMKRPPRFRDPWYLLPEAGSERPSGLTPETGLDEAIAGLATRTGRRMVSSPTGGIMTSPPVRSVAAAL